MLHHSTAQASNRGPAFLEFDTTLITTVGSPLKWAMLRDIERGSATEGKHILGDIVARAPALGIETPILDLTRTHTPLMKSTARALLLQS